MEPYRSRCDAEVMLRPFLGSVIHSPAQSTCSLDTGDVLIRSTRIPGPERGPGQNTVQLGVQELLDCTTVQLALKNHDRQTETSLSNLSEHTKENITPTTPPEAEPPPEMEPWTQQPSKRTSQSVKQSTKDHQDLLTSRFSSGGRGAGLAALKQRSHTSTRKREVRVKLLEQQSLQTSSQNVMGAPEVQTAEESLSAQCSDIRNTAPANKAQSHMEAQVSKVVDSVQWLLQAERDNRESGRSLNQQVLQHLETVHGRQLQLQSQLLDSAFKMVSSHASSAAPASAVGNGNQQQRSSAFVETGPVTMATVAPAHRPLETSDCCHHGREGSGTAAEAAKNVNEVLKEMRRLRSEMKTLLKPQDTLTTTRPPPEHQHNLFHDQQNRPQNQLNHSCRDNTHQTNGHSAKKQTEKNYQRHHVAPHIPDQTHQNFHHPQQTQSQKTQTHQDLAKSRTVQSRTHQPDLNQGQVDRRSEPVHRVPTAPSTLEKAGQVLRQVQKQKKVLEENLEALMRAKNGEVLHCQLEALAANRDYSDQVRIKKTVDTWISSLSRDIQAELSSEYARAKTAGCPTPSVKIGSVSASRQTGSKMAGGRGPGRVGGAGQKVGHRAGPELSRVTSEQPEVESCLMHLYGRAPYEGVRRTLKKSPYLRLSSPPRASSNRKPRPRLVESVKGVKVKSCKTQTSMDPPSTVSPERPQQLDFRRSGDAAGVAAPRSGLSLVSVAVPLGRRRFNTKQLTEPQQEVTSPVRPAPNVRDKVPGRPLHLDAGEASPSPPPVIEVESDEGGDQTSLPGAGSLSAADAAQEEVSDVSEVGEGAVELDGGPSLPPVQYEGPVFPPQTFSNLPVQHQNPVPDPTLESRLVDWVEQQLMSRMISEMYHPPPADPTQDVPTDQSELEERSVTSDIVEAAGGAGLQLFVDSDTPVDSALIRQLVNEVLSETVAVVLGQRHSSDPDREPATKRPGPEPGTNQENTSVLLVPTPVPTPPPSIISALTQTVSLNTPPPSEPTTPKRDRSPEPVPHPEITTPTPSPVNAPPVNSPPPLTPPTLTWGNAELPLEEERPEESGRTNVQQLVMSVAEEEPPVSSPFPHPVPQRSSPPPPPPPEHKTEERPTSASSSSESASISSGSTVTTETDAMISEGRLLISVNHSTEDDGALCSFNSSLQELQDMDQDPPSEGQIRGPDLLLNLLNKTQEETTQTEVEDLSVGEVRANQMIIQQQHSDSPGQLSAGLSQGSSGAPDQYKDGLTFDSTLSPCPHLEITEQVDFLLRRKTSEGGLGHQQHEEEQPGNRKLFRAEENDVINQVMKMNIAPLSDSSSSSDVF